MDMNSNVCRLCTKVETLVNVFSESENDLQEKILKCFGVKISDVDPISRNICKSCYFFTNSAYEYRVSSQRNDNILWNEYEESRLDSGNSSKSRYPSRDITQNEFLNSLNLTNKQDNIDKKQKTVSKLHPSIVKLKQTYSFVRIPYAWNNLDINPYISLGSKTVITTTGVDDLGVWSVNHKTLPGKQTGVVLTRLKETKTDVANDATPPCTSRQSSPKNVLGFNKKNAINIRPNGRKGKRKRKKVKESILCNRNVSKNECIQELRVSSPELTGPFVPEKEVQLNKPIEKRKSTSKVNEGWKPKVAKVLPQKVEHTEGATIDSLLSTDENLLITVGEVVKTFICQTCNKVFDSVSALNQHKRCNHKSSLRCSECAEKFALVESLLEHKRIHHREEDSKKNGPKLAESSNLAPEDAVTSTTDDLTLQEGTITTSGPENVPSNNGDIKVDERRSRANVAKKSTGGVLKSRVKRDKDVVDISSDSEVEHIEVIESDEVTTSSNPGDEAKNFCSVLEVALKAQVHRLSENNCTDIVPRNPLLNTLFEPPSVAEGVGHNDSDTTANEHIEDRPQETNVSNNVYNVENDSEDDIIFVSSTKEPNESLQETQNANDTDKREFVNVPAKDPSVSQDEKVSNYVACIAKKFNDVEKATTDKMWVLKGMREFMEKNFLPVEMHRSINQIVSVSFSAANSSTAVRTPPVPFWNNVTPIDVPKTDTSNTYRAKPLTNIPPKNASTNPVVTVAPSIREPAASQQIGTYSKDTVNLPDANTNLVYNRNANQPVESLNESLITYYYGTNSNVAYVPTSSKQPMQYANLNQTNQGNQSEMIAPISRLQQNVARSGGYTQNNISNPNTGNQLCAAIPVTISYSLGQSKPVTISYIVTQGSSPNILTETQTSNAQQSNLTQNSFLSQGGRENSSNASGTAYPQSIMPNTKQGSQVQNSFQNQGGPNISGQTPLPTAQQSILAQNSFQSSNVSGVSYSTMLNAKQGNLLQNSFQNQNSPSASYLRQPALPSAKQSSLAQNQSGRGNSSNISSAQCLRPQSAIPNVTQHSFQNQSAQVQIPSSVSSTGSYSLPKTNRTVLPNILKTALESMRQTRVPPQNTYPVQGNQCHVPFSGSCLNIPYPPNATVVPTSFGQPSQGHQTYPSLSKPSMVLNARSDSTFTTLRSSQQSTQSGASNDLSLISHATRQYHAGSLNKNAGSNLSHTFPHPQSVNISTQQSQQGIQSGATNDPNLISQSTRQYHAGSLNKNAGPNLSQTFPHPQSVITSTQQSQQSIQSGATNDPNLTSLTARRYHSGSLNKNAGQNFSRQQSVDTSTQQQLLIKQSSSSRVAGHLNSTPTQETRRNYPSSYLNQKSKPDVHTAQLAGTSSTYPSSSVLTEQPGLKSLPTQKPSDRYPTDFFNGQPVLNVRPTPQTSNSYPPNSLSATEQRNRSFVSSQKPSESYFFDQKLTLTQPSVSTSYASTSLSTTGQLSQTSVTSIQEAKETQNRNSSFGPLLSSAFTEQPGLKSVPTQRTDFFNDQPVLNVRPNPQAINSYPPTSLSVTEQRNQSFTSNQKPSQSYFFDQKPTSIQRSVSTSCVSTSLSTAGQLNQNFVPSVQEAKETQNRSSSSTQNVDQTNTSSNQHTFDNSSAPSELTQNPAPVQEATEAKPSIRIKSMSELTGQILNTDERIQLHNFYSQTLTSYINKHSNGATSQGTNEYVEIS